MPGGYILAPEALDDIAEIRTYYKEKAGTRVALGRVAMDQRVATLSHREKAVAGYLGDLLKPGRQHVGGQLHVEPVSTGAAREVQQEPVASPQDVQERLERFRKQNRKTVLMLVQSGDGLRWIPVPLAEQSDKKPG